MSELAKVENNNMVPADSSHALINMIERAATNPDVDVEKLERMWAMYDKERSRMAQQAFNAAFASMQNDMPEIREGGAIKHNEKLISTYGRWDEDINPVIKPILQQHGFALSFRIDTKEGVNVEAVLCHEAGHCERTDIKLPVDSSGSKNAVQAVASSVSYGKRYTACSLLNISTYGSDDDGKAAGQGKTISQDQALNIQALIDETKSDKAKFLRYMSTQCNRQITKIADIPETAFKLAVQQLEKKRNGHAATK